MNIVFFWDERINSNNIGVPLGGGYDIAYFVEKQILKIKYIAEYYNIWNTGVVKDFVALVGENGTGKTKLLNILMDDLNALKANDVNSIFPFIIVVDNERQLDIYTHKVLIEIDAEEGIPVNKTDSTILFDHFEVAYFNNQFLLQDYFEEEGRCRFDFSLGHKIRRDGKHSREMDYIDLKKDIITEYSKTENYNIIQFLYLNSEDAVRENNIGYPFTFPEYITIKIDDNNRNFENIFEKLESELRSRKDEQTKRSIFDIDHINKLDKIKDKLNRLNRYLDWENKIYFELIIILIKGLCIDQSTGDYRHRQIADVLKMTSNLCDKLSINTLKKDLMEYTDELMSCPGINESSKIFDIDPAKKFVEWIDKNRAFISENKSHDFLTIHLEEKTKDFMLSLLEVYDNIKLGYPFLDFSFGLSSGEYNYLQLFADLFKIVKEKEDLLYFGQNNLILLFDEAELTMHPRWQRKYCSWLKDYCNRIFVGLSIKIIITTHSPILLSDFPAYSVTYIKNDNDERKYYRDLNLRPFGCDVTTLYSDSFFLDDDGTIGKLAKDYINKLAREISSKELEKTEAESQISIIGERIFRIKLNELMKDHYD